jgi:mRNA capping enzyme
MPNRDQGYPDAQPTSKLVICTRLEPQRLSDCWTLLASDVEKSPNVNWLLAMEQVEQQVAAPNGLKLLSTVYAYDDSPDPPFSRAVWVAGLVPEKMVAPLLDASRLFHRSTITVKRMDGSLRQHLSEKDLSNSRTFRDVVQRLRKENLAIVLGQDKYHRFGIMRPRLVPDETNEGRDFVVDCYVAKIKDVQVYVKNSVLPAHTSLSTHSSIEETDSVHGGFDAETEEANHDSSWKPPAAEEYSFNTTSSRKPPTEDDDDHNDTTNGETQSRSWNSEHDSGWGMPSKKTRLDDSTHHRDAGAAAADEFYSPPRSLDRADSRLFHMRAFNNWVKATQIAELDPKSGPAVTGKKKQRAATGTHSALLRVLDLACGKGGDLGKWVRCSRGIGNYVGSDAAQGSLRDAASWSLLLGIVDNRRIQQLAVTHKIEWSDSEHKMPEMLFDGLFLHVLPEHASLKVVHVILQIEADDSSDPFDEINEFFRWQLDWFDTHPTMFHNMGVGSLLFLNVGVCVDGYVGDGESIHHTRHMKTNKWWDNFITPGLSLNWYRDHEEHASHWSGTPLGAPSGENKTVNALLTLRVRAINFDILYSKSTIQLPFDTRTANASVIGHLLQRKLSRRESTPFGSC